VSATAGQVPTAGDGQVPATASSATTNGGKGGVTELHVHVHGVTPAAIAQEIHDALAPLLGPSSAGVSM
jgi:hypothetical protein